ncbi:matrix metalloproteinase-19-like [Toxorhynchites rutilus septentrionalis]|uniref:matrix metalloproteinase-19-like n=1 Tax=Toxorhynchites rutilus septentrionalis TaxID=329112 RepID=UPI0024791E27|nr:matrix metalloproteinase-19-like [Toxorhynchites rutilus septentrionalis]
MIRPRDLVFVLVVAFHVSMVCSAAVFVERPFHDEPFYPSDLDGANSTKYRDLTAGFKWNKTLLSYSIINFPTGVPPNLIRTTIRRAFDAWSRYTNLNFVESLSAMVDIQLAFEGVNHYRRGLPCRFSQEITLAHAFFPEDGDIHFNKKYFFTEGASIEQFLNTAVHEIGHSLGLLHSSSRKSIMYGAQLQELFSEPQPEDIQAIQEIYGIRSAPQTTTQPPPRAITTPKPRTTTELCSLSSFDTIVTDHRGNVCVLAGRFYYNLNETNPPPRKISAKWPGLPPNVDAAFTYRDQKTYFFKGDQYWKYDKLRMEENYPRSIAVSFPGVPQDMDTILLSPTAGFHAFRGTQYWFYDTRKLKPVERHFPKLIRELGGFPARLDAALLLGERRYIFSDLRYYEVDDETRIVGESGDVRRDWFNCV